jgi:hypothetical protein
VRNVAQGVLKKQHKLAVPRQEHRATVGHGHCPTRHRITIEHIAVPQDKLIVVAEARVVGRADFLQRVDGLDKLLAFALGEPFYVLADARRTMLLAVTRILGHGQAALAHGGAGDPQGHQESRERQERGAARPPTPAWLCIDLGCSFWHDQVSFAISLGRSSLSRVDRDCKLRFECV